MKIAGLFFYAKIYQMLETIILGLTQGIAEWLPISSEGAIVAIKNTFFPTGLLLSDTIKLALFLHFGTFMAALIYFRKDVWTLIQAFFKPKESSPENRKVLFFLIISTLISGGLGFLLFKSLAEFESQIETGSAFINLFVAALLFITAFLQLVAKKDSASWRTKNEENLTTKDGIILGLVQGFAVLPGLSRSGLTVSTLLLKKFNDTVALRLSFLMSMPIVLLGNIILVLPTFSFSFNALISLVAAFASGLLTIHLLLRLSKKINFGYFALLFGVLLIISVFF